MAKMDSIGFIFRTENLLYKLATELSRERVDVVVIDTFTDIYSGDMNQINQVRHFLNQYSNLAKQYACAIIFNHHTGKYTEDKPRIAPTLSVAQVSRARYGPCLNSARTIQTTGSGICVL